jgi:hypothetical protein
MRGEGIGDRDNKVTKIMIPSLTLPLARGEDDSSSPWSGE